jgi:hypothetical protein
MSITPRRGETEFKFAQGQGLSVLTMALGEVPNLYGPVTLL